MLKLIINQGAIYTVLKIRHVHGYHAFQIILSHEYVLSRFQLQCNASRHIIIAGVLNIYRNMSKANGCLNGDNKFIWPQFLAATKQLYGCFFLSVRLSVRLSVCPSHLFDYVPIIVSSLNVQELSPRNKVTSMQKVKVRGQRSRSQRSQPNLTVSGL